MSFGPSFRFALTFAIAVLGSACSVTSSPLASLDAGGADSGEPTDPADLKAPPTGQGVYMTTGPFAVPAGTEVQDCYFFQVSALEQAAGLPTTQPIDVHRIQIVQKAGTHHMNLFRVRTIVNLAPPPTGAALQTGTNGAGQCFNSANWADWPLVANMQQGGVEVEDWSYPDGVANEIQPTEWLMLQTHYVNASTQTTPDGGEVAINLWTIPADQVTAQIGTLFATDQNIRICQSDPTPTYSQGCQFNSATPVTIIGANGHFHSRGTEFDMYVWDGTSTTTPAPSERFYQSLSWDDPPMLHSPQLEQTVPANGGVWYSCAYQWEPPPNPLSCATLNMLDQTKHMTPPAEQDCCYTFGPIVNENEHCNAFIYYYPALESVMCQ
ncbi:MAG: hypothetical protein ACLP1X_19520 [Polyangiaceae bacterium]|jgi:hypothetical protein